MKRMIALSLCLVMVLGLFTGIVSAADPTIGNPIQEKTQLTDVSQLSTITSDYYHANFQHDGVTYYLRLGAVIMGNVHIDDGGSGSRDLADAASTVYYLAAFYTFDELTEQWIRVSEATAGTLLALFDGTAGNQFSMRVEPTANCEYIPAVNKVTHMGDWVAEYPWLAGSQIIYSDSTGDCLGT